MTRKMPPVPPANQSHKGTGDNKQPRTDADSAGRTHTENPDQQGRQANIKQNTTNQGYQQDR